MTLTSQPCSLVPREGLRRCRGSPSYNLHSWRFWEVVESGGGSESTTDGISQGKNSNRFGGFRDACLIHCTRQRSERAQVVPEPVPASEGEGLQFQFRGCVCSLIPITPPSVQLLVVLPFFRGCWVSPCSVVHCACPPRGPFVIWPYRWRLTLLEPHPSLFLSSPHFAPHLPLVLH
jgi:hypothetical protein